jgi:hypothetical protein
MDHSVQAYLEHMPTEKLLVFLQQCMQNWSSYDYAVPQIFRTLAERGYCIPDTVVDSWNCYLEEQH